VQIDRLSLVLASGMSQQNREFGTLYRQLDVEAIPLITRAIGAPQWPVTALRSLPRCSNPDAIGAHANMPAA
jgi:hypothetical protein